MKRINILLIGLVITLLSPLVFADNAVLEEMFEMLRENGSITESQHERLVQVLAENEKAEEKPLDSVNVSTEGGLEISSADDAFSFELGGRIMTDAAFFFEDRNKLGDGTKLRRARLEMEGKMFHDWIYDFAIDFADGTGDIKDAFIGYKGFSSVDFKFGQFKEPFSLEEITSSRYVTFMERGLPNMFVPGRNIGVGAYTNWDNVTASAGIFGEPFDVDIANEGNESWAVAGRLTYVPIKEKDKLLHLGVASEYRDKEVSFSERPESDLTEIKFANTGTISDIRNTVKYGLEGAMVWGPWSLQSEYIYTDVNRNNVGDLDFNGWYVFGSWFLTGESRQYKFKKSAFARVKPKNSFGAWELALRYSGLDLTDGVVTGGEERNLTLGLNWYINSHVRAMANYVFVDNDVNANAAGTVLGDDDPNIFQMRLQADF